MKKYIILAVLVVIIALVWIFHKQLFPAKQISSTKPRIVASFYPLAFIAQGVGGDAVEVQTLVPAGTEPHEYEPTPKQLESVHSATIFMFNGGSLDPWAEKIAPELGKAGVIPVKATAGVELLQGIDEATGAEVPDSTDPHVWLDPSVLEQLAKRLENILVQIDTSHAEAYKANTTALVARLTELDMAYKTGLATCARRDIITSHTAFGYLARRYQVHQVAIAGLSPESEPTPTHIAHLVDLVKQKGITTIFFETLTSPKLADTLAQEAGVQTAVLNPLEGVTAEEQARGDNYVTLMQSNLDQLRMALNCT